MSSKLCTKYVKPRKRVGKEIMELEKKKKL
jgi:hypothetical protein